MWWFRDIVLKTRLNSILYDVPKRARLSPLSDIDIKKVCVSNGFEATDKGDKVIYGLFSYFWNSKYEK